MLSWLAIFCCILIMRAGGNKPARRRPRLFVYVCPLPLGKPLDMLGALSLSKRLWVLSLPQVMSRVEWLQVMSPVEWLQVMSPVEWSKRL